MRRIEGIGGKDEVFAERTLLRLRCKGCDRGMEKRIVDDGNAGRGRKEREAFVEFSIRERVEASLY